MSLRLSRLARVIASIGVVGGIGVATAGAVDATGTTQPSATAKAGSCSTSATGLRFGTTLRSDWSEREPLWLRYSGGPLCTIRVYLATIGHGKTWAKTDLLAHQPANQRVIFSFRGGAPADITAFERSRPAGTQCYGSYWHEPENTFKTPSGRAAYRSKWASYASAIRAGGCKTILILQGYTATDKADRWQDYYNPGAIDMFGWDAHSFGSRDTPPVYRDPAILLAGPQNVARVTGKPWGIAEAGAAVLRTDPYGVRRVAWIKAYHTDLVKATPAPRFATWDDSRQQSDMDFYAGVRMIRAWMGTS